MIKRKNTIALLCAVTLFAGMMTACSEKDDTSKESSMSTSVSTSTTKAAEPTKVPDTPTPVPAVNTSKEWHEGLEPRTIYVRDEHMDEAVFDESDNRALAAVMKKAEKGEEVTIVCIGGSITQGTISNGKKDSGITDKKFYADIIKEWWTTRFPDTKINFVNAGIGATTSYLGVHRAGTDVLAHDPDLVIVEFAVNDAGLKNGQTIYENLVRNILNYKSKPAVMLLFMGQTNGSTAQKDELPIGQAYALPMISYTNVINSMMKNGEFTAEELSGDTVHPSALGHAATGELFWNYFNAVYYDRNSLGDPEDFNAPAITSEKYTNAKILDSLTITPDEYGSFADSKKFNQFPNDWTTETGEGELTFTVNCANLGLMYYKTTNGKSGQFDVLVDGEIVATLNADFKGGWGNYAESAEVFTSDTAAEHKVVIKKSESSENTGFTVLGLMVSGGEN